jgi:hypothetical protein
LGATYYPKISLGIKIVAQTDEISHNLVTLLLSVKFMKCLVMQSSKASYPFSIPGDDLVDWIGISQKNFNSSFAFHLIFCQIFKKFLPGW